MDDLMGTIDALRRLHGELAVAEGQPRAGAPLVVPDGATLRAISAVERRIKCRLPPSYRAFLHAQDGFPAVIHGASLFGTSELGRSEHATTTRAVFAAYETPIPEVGTPARPQGRSDAMIPFGMDEGAHVIFAFNPAVVREGGEMEVIVWINGLGDRCEDFTSFLALLRDMLANEVVDRHELRRSA